MLERSDFSLKAHSACLPRTCPSRRPLSHTFKSVDSNYNDKYHNISFDLEADKVCSHLQSRLHSRDYRLTARHRFLWVYMFWSSVCFSLFLLLVVFVHLISVFDAPIHGSCHLARRTQLYMLLRMSLLATVTLNYIRIHTHISLDIFMESPSFLKAMSRHFGQLNSFESHATVTMGCSVNQLSCDVMWGLIHLLKTL